MKISLYNYKDIDELTKKALYLSDTQIERYFDIWYNNLILNYPTAPNTNIFSNENRDAFFNIFNNLDIPERFIDLELKVIKDKYKKRLNNNLDTNRQIGLDRKFLNNFIDSLEIILPIEEETV